MVREFLSKVPALVGTKNPERKSEMLVALFDRELQPGSTFQRNEEDIGDPYNRSEPVESLLRSPGVDEKKLCHCMNLLRIMEWSHYVREHDDSEIQWMLNTAIEDATADEVHYPDVTAVLTVEQATALSGWNI